MMNEIDNLKRGQPDQGRGMGVEINSHKAHAISKLRSGKELPNPYKKLEKEEIREKRTQRKVQLSENISSFLLDSMPKEKYPGAHFIKCEINSMLFPKSLLDSGVSVNLMPKVLFDKFKFKDLEPICIDLLVADGSVRQPQGRLFHVPSMYLPNLRILVRIQQCTFHVDFIMADMNVIENFSQSTIILGQPFLAIVKAITDWEKGTIELKVGEEKVELNMTKFFENSKGFHKELGTCELLDENDEEPIGYLLEIQDLNPKEDPTNSLRFKGDPFHPILELNHCLLH
ncbi:unnamed protein product [Spirodela intermedia]|uniref:Aspartic peptidase DDI1-type domain-containing protein n=1 Tax=Spirodela intermedia TaxID=51605 RepID=A0ABN7EA33_SPIIN|nr:unnamed protein product [Spirodela intermedia]